MRFAEVAVNAAAPLRQTFTYRIPDNLAVEPGHAVYVPFGTRSLQGIVISTSTDPAYPDARDISDVIDPRPMISPERLKLASWLSRRYLAPLFDCVSLMLPPGFKQRPLTFLYSRYGRDEIPGLRLTERQAAVLEAVIERGEVEANELQRSLRTAGTGPAVASLIKRGLLERRYRLSRPGAQPKRVAVVRLLAPEPEVRATTRRLRESGSVRDLRRAQVLDSLADDVVTPLRRAREIGLTAALQRDLQAAGVIAVEHKAVLRDPLAGRTFARREPPVLTDGQAAVVSSIERALESGRHQTFLLHGVTGSGKTEVYLAALDRCVALGRRAIVLVPEISLTPQTVRRFGERFPDEVAVMHSGLPTGEHFDMWHGIRDGRYRVVVGPRGALFAPQPGLGLVVIDEEHEWTYKQQEGSPRYHARRVAEELCRWTGAVLVLGSATPDVESHFRAQEGRYRLLELPQRLQRDPTGGVRPGPLPEVEIVDLRAELKAGNRSIFSRSLGAAVRQVLAQGEQAMLFLNRRGTASFVQCRDCGHVPQCRSCAVALTYHEAEAGLVCHYCRRRIPLPATCPACGGPRIRQVGLGTERVEEEAKRAFPGARTLRWDRDVTRGRGSHEAILARFLAHEADILIGTQMIAKGLDIPLVTLVGVVSADIALHLPDFRAGERTFQLLEQVAGRAGRGPRGGRVIIQTYTPDHYAIRAAGAHDYHAFYQQEIEFRRRLGYPPYGRLIRLTYAHTGERHALEQAAMMARRLRNETRRLGIANLDVLGPAPAFVPRVRGRWRWNVVLRGSEPARVLEETPIPRGWSVDVDPASLL